VTDSHVILEVVNTLSDDEALLSGPMSPLRVSEKLIMSQLAPLNMSLEAGFLTGGKRCRACQELLTSATHGWPS